MSYALVSKIDCPFKMRDVSGSPFGNAISGKEGRVVFCLLLGGISDAILGIGKSNSDWPLECEKFLRQTFETYGGFALVVRNFSGDIFTEFVTLEGSRKLGFEEFCSEFPALEENVRYVVVWG